MPIYEYYCSICEQSFDKFVSVKDRHNVSCCGSLASKIISLPNTEKDKSYDFVTDSINGKPMEIRSKGQYKRLLKQNGIADASPRECFQQAMKCKKSNEESRKLGIRKRAKVAAQKMRASGVVKEGKEILTKMANSGRR
jgi:putative FmdB family regulatory protein